MAKRLLKRIALVAVFSLVIFAGVLSVMWSVVYYQRKQFEELSERVSRLRVGQSTFVDLRGLRSAYGSRATEDGPCTPNSCNLRVVVANFLVNHNSSKAADARWLNVSVLRRLGIRPGAAVASVTVRNEMIRRVDFTTTYQTSLGFWLWAGWNESDLSPFQRCVNQMLLKRHPTYLLFEGWTNSTESGPWVSAWFQPAATDGERKLCRKIRFSCITSLVDCAGDPSSGARVFMPQFEKSLVEEREFLRANNDEYRKLIDGCEFLAHTKQ